MPIDPKDIATLTPTFFNTIFKHVRHESPDANWDLKLHLGVAMVRSFLARGKHKTIERQQKFLQRYYIPTPPSVQVNKTTVPDSCRSQAEDIMSGLLSGMEERVGWRWREDPAKKLPLRAEWVDIKSRRKAATVERVLLYVHGGAYFLGSAAQHRFMVQKVARAAGARAFSVDYRLAPQSPFPAALIDTLAAYLYLTSPTTGAGINPKNIVIMGDSAGGGLTIATLMVLRDAGLPMPAAGVCWSPWVDMFHSLPSVMTNTDTDYVPNGFVHKPSPANPIKDYRDVNQRLARIQYYAFNSALDIPYVSPIMSEDLGGLGQLCINCGNGERLRDESVLLAHKAAKTHPEIFDTAHSPGQHSFPPTQVTLHVYDAMPHVFQMFSFHPCAKSSVNRTAAFIRKVIPEPSLERTPTVHTLVSLSDVPSEHSSHDKARSLDDDDSAFADDDFYFVKRHFDVKGALRESDYTDGETLRQWQGMLGRLPDFEKHPEFLEV